MSHNSEHKFQALRGLFSNRIKGLCLAGAAFSGFFAQAQTKSVQLKGRVAGFPSLVKDDVLHGALVIPSLRPMDILGFQFKEMLSSPEDMSAGPISVKAPGNLYIPSQRESYGWLPITLSKESFTVNVDSNRDEELVALQFRAQHSKLLDALEDKKPYLEIFPLVKLESVGVLDNRHYDKNQELLNIPLNFKIQNAINFSWNRPKNAKNEADLALLMQETPAGRWIVTDVQSQITSQKGILNSSSRLGERFVSLMGRVRNKADGNLESLAAHFSHFQRGEDLNLEGVPPFLSGVGHGGVGAKTLRWDPVNEEGWMAIFHIQKTPRVFGVTRRTKSILSSSSNEMGTLLTESLSVMSLLGMGGFFQMLDIARPSSFLGWTSPRAGSFDLGRPVRPEDRVIALFVETHRPVNQPSFEVLEDSHSADEIFSEAKSVRMTIIE